jgi:DNA-binding NtrC family response regulator
MDDFEPPPEETRFVPVALAPQFRSQPRLEWTDATGAHAVLVDGKKLVGSASGSGVVVQDATVSRLHAELEPREDGLWVRDLGSRNGTFVNGLQVSGARVPDKGKVRLGNVELLIDYGAAPKKPIETWPETKFGRLVGGSAPMRELFAMLARVAPMNASVLVQGETGTGKELVARAIHDASPRAKAPFVVVDCAALPENLLDAELFGHTKGAFTGAVSARPGAIEAAEGGTVFLDEIGELPIQMQPKLLRVLESRTIRRLGESAHRNVDVRFISATHRDLLTMVSVGEFREDLYFRLSVIPVTVPPLRDRRDDMQMLVNHFFASFGGGSVSPELLSELVARPWRGNVRELRNFAERALALGTNQALAMASADGARSARMAAAPAAGVALAAAVAPAAESESSGFVPPRLAPHEAAMFEQAYKDFRESWVDAGEKEYVRRLLLRHDRNVAAAAREAGVDRTYIYRLIRKHDL